MRTIATKKSAEPPAASKPFFSKRARNPFFAPTQQAQTPFFSPYTLHPKRLQGQAADPVQTKTDRVAGPIRQNHLGQPTLQRKPATSRKEAQDFAEGVIWLLAFSSWQYRQDDHIKYPERHPNTLRQSLQIMRRWFLRARTRVRTALDDDPALQKKLKHVYRIYVYSAIEAFERKLKQPSWKLYEAHKDDIDDLAGPPPTGKKQKPAYQLDNLDAVVLPKLRAARCGTNREGVEFCGNVLATPEGGFRVTGVLTNQQEAVCGETITPQAGERHVAYYHSHPRDRNAVYPPADPNLNFSQFDKDQADRQQLIYYLVNWQNKVLKYYPKQSQSQTPGRTIEITKFENLSCDS